MKNKKFIKSIALALLTMNIGGALINPIRAETIEKTKQTRSSVGPQVECDIRARSIACLEGKIKVSLKRAYSLRFNKVQVSSWKKERDIKITLTNYQNEFE